MPIPKQRCAVWLPLVLARAGDAETAWQPDLPSAEFRRVLDGQYTELRALLSDLG